MKYPITLLPQPNYTPILFNENHQNCFILRHTESQNNRDEFGKLDASCLAAQTDHLKDYSTNLSPNFALEDAKIRLLKGENFSYFTQLWHGVPINLIPRYPIDFDIENNRGMFFLRIGDINGAIFNDFDDNLPSKPVCKVIHTPTNSNFWHCSIRWFLDNKDTIDMSKNERRRILSIAKTFLIEQAYFDLPDFDRVQNADYQKNINI